MSLYQKLFKQTTIYGLATVLPRMLSFFLVRLHTDQLQNTADYGVVTIVFSWIIFMNVILSYGMETAFFRFYNTEINNHKVKQTSLTMLLCSSMLFLIITVIFKENIANLIEIPQEYLLIVIGTLFFDALVIIPFANIRLQQQPIRYAVIKVANTTINLVLNLFFLLLLPKLASNYPIFNWIYISNFEVGYIFLANLVASFLTFVYLLPDYFKVKLSIDKELAKRMLVYALPILLAGVAFAINEHFDKILLEKLLPDDIAKQEVGIYATCYKLGLFMVLFTTAFRLGIEPFLFSYAQNEDAKKTYALITKYFVILGCIIMLGVIVFADVLKIIMINEKYWNAMAVVPLIILANLFLGIYNNLSIWYKLTNRTIYGAYISIFGAVITLILNFLLIPKYSYMGSAWATLAAYFSMMMVSYWLGKKYYDVPYQVGKILLYLLISTALSGIYFYLFRENYIVGITFVALFTIIVYFNERQAIKSLLKK